MRPVAAVAVAVAFDLRPFIVNHGKINPKYPDQYE